jgi:hypothetical protein
MYAMNTLAFTDQKLRRKMMMWKLIRSIRHVTPSICSEFIRSYPKDWMRAPNVKGIVTKSNLMRSDFF